MWADRVEVRKVLVWETEWSAGVRRTPCGRVMAALRVGYGAICDLLVHGIVAKDVGQTYFEV